MTSSTTFSSYQAIMHVKHYGDARPCRGRDRGSIPRTCSNYLSRKETSMTSVLVLNCTYEALGIVDLRRAVRLVFAGKAEVLHADEGEMRSASIVIRLPSIVRMLYFIRRGRPRVSLTKKNVLLRDDYKCAYCGARGDRQMTVDHVLPSSRGGRSSWENLVACCGTCNKRKQERKEEE